MISEYSVVPGKPNSDIRDAREEQIANDPDKHEIGKQHEGPTCRDAVYAVRGSGGLSADRDRSLARGGTRSAADPAVGCGGNP